MKTTTITGFDPGLVHTGAVGLGFYPVEREIVVTHEAIVGPDEQAVKAFAERLDAPPKHRFIEGYKPRSNFGTNPKMIEAVAKMRGATKGVVLLNTGVKKVVRQPLMELLGVWKFSTPTNHDDLRSAARIALLGALKDECLNRVLFEIVRDHLNGRTWHVRG